MLSIVVRKARAWALLCVGASLAFAPEIAGARRAIPYQMELTGVAGEVAVEVSLFDAASGGALVWGPERHPVLVMAANAVDYDYNGHDGDADAYLLARWIYLGAYNDEQSVLFDVFGNLIVTLIFSSPVPPLLSTEKV